jgi:hypothetical protein
MHDAANKRNQPLKPHVAGAFLLPSSNVPQAAMVRASMSLRANSTPLWCCGCWRARLRDGRCLSVRLRGVRSRWLREVLFGGIEQSPAKYGKGRKHTCSHDTHYYVPLLPEAGGGFASVVRNGSIRHDTPPCPVSPDAQQIRTVRVPRIRGINALLLHWPLSASRRLLLC